MRRLSYEGASRSGACPRFAYGPLARPSPRAARPGNGVALRSASSNAVRKSGSPDVPISLANILHSDSVAVVIGSFACKDTERVYHRERVKRWADEICRVANRKLVQMEASSLLSDLKVPPGNHLEALKGDRKGQHSIRVNDQWRLCFTWKGDAALAIELVDYH